MSRNNSPLSNVNANTTSGGVSFQVNFAEDNQPLNGPPTYSSEGTAKRVLADYKNMYNKLYKQFQKVTIKCQQYREETHDLRSAADTTNKQMEYLTRKVAHITSERDKFKSEKEKNELILKKLDHKLAGGSGGQYLAEKYKELRRRNKTLKDKVKLQHDVISSQEGNLLKASKEIEVLARALEIRSEELHLNPNSSVEDTLLYQVARLKRDLQNGDDELRQKNDEINNMLQDNVRLTTELKSLEEIKNAVEERLVNVRAECEDAKKLSEISANRAEELEKERAIMLDYIKEMQAKIGDLESKNTNDNKMNNNKIRLLENRLSEMKGHDGDITSKLELAEKRIEQMKHVQKLTEQRLSDEHVKNLNFQEHIELQSKDSATQLAATDALKEKILALEDEKSVTDRKLDLLRKTHEEKDLAIEDMVKSLSAVKGQLNDVILDKDTTEARYRSEFEGIMSELEKAVLDKERSEAAMRQAVDKYETLTNEKNAAEETLKAAQDDVLMLRENKGMLQKTMLEQLNGLRKEVKRLTVERDDAVEELLCVREEKDRAEILMNAAKATNLTYKSTPTSAEKRSGSNASSSYSSKRYESRNATEHMEHVRSALKKYGNSKSNSDYLSGSNKKQQTQGMDSLSATNEGFSPSLLDLAAANDDSYQ
jgi:chromosome segregation ATPase